MGEPGRVSNRVTRGADAAPLAKLTRPGSPSNTTGDQVMNNDRPTSRREFLRNTSAAVAGGVLATGAYAAGTDVLRIGLVGCGGRGTGAAGQALKADKAVKLF